MLTIMNTAEPTPTSVYVRNPRRLLAHFALHTDRGGEEKRQAPQPPLRDTLPPPGRLPPGKQIVRSGTLASPLTVIYGVPVAINIDWEE